MASPLLDQARTGNAQAIAALIQRSLGPKGFTVQGDRQYQRLTLRVRGDALPPQTKMVSYLRQGVERLHIHGLTHLEIYGEQTDGPSWHQTVPLGPALEGEDWSPELDAAFAPITPAPEPPAQSLEQLTWAYELLKLPAGADLAAVEARYFQQKADLIRRGDRAALEPLKVAYGKLKAALEAAIPPPEPSSIPAAMDSPGPVAPPTPDLSALSQVLQRQGLRVQLVVQADQLQVRLPAPTKTSPRQALARIYRAIAQQDLQALGLKDCRILVVYALSAQRQVVWKQSAPLPETGLSEADTDLFSFANRRSNTVIFPALLLLGMVMNALPLVNALLRGIKIWFHEFGHATVAWLAGRQALPLPIGWTNVGSQRSLFVYVGLLILFGLLYRAGHQEKRQWPMVLAGILAGLQFWMTWLLPTQTFEMLMYFGGIGGEFYLCALLMVSFYFPLPHYFRWDFYRYPVVLGAAFTFWDQFWLWKRIAWGQASIPFGAMWGDPNHGDMNRLVNDYGWTPLGLTGTYNAIANLCILTMLSVYLYIFVKQNRPWLFALSQRWFVRP
jgi:hypothetical protein